jgi:hypothetical protein
VAAVVELLRAHELDHGRVTAGWNEIVRSVWRDPIFDIQEDGWIVERGGVPVAFAGVFHEDVANGETSMSWVASPPTDRADGVLPFLVDRLIARARGRGARALRHLVYRDDDAHRTAVLERGFRRVRSEWTMYREIGPDGPDPGHRTASASRPWRSIPTSAVSTGRTRRRSLNTSGSHRSPSRFGDDAGSMPTTTARDGCSHSKEIRSSRSSVR